MEKSMLDIMWILISAGLIFMMQAGFLCLESGLTRSKNAINVAIKNVTDFGIAAILFWLFGFGLMFGASGHGLIGTSLFFPAVGGHDYWLAAFFIFQLMYCATAATIVSGAVAERLRFSGYIYVTVIISALIYPVFGHWVWGGEYTGVPGWLAARGFVDFAGSTVVHSVGGWVALAVLLIVGPRHGRFSGNDTVNKISGSNIPLALLGSLLLMFGWIGFNGGNTMAMNHQVPGIVVNTVLAGSAGLVAALFTGWRIRGVPEVELAINGMLGGLVSITAGCHAVDAASAVIIGLAGGLVVLAAESLLLKLKIDDAVGAIPSHLGCGLWGTLAAGIFGRLDLLGTGLTRGEQIQAQLSGMGVGAVYSFGTAYVLLWLINRFFALRVTPEEEHAGLNVSEHNASTEILGLLTVMELQARTQDISQRVPVEPFTEIGQIASRYNRVLDSLQKQRQETTQMFDNLKESHEQLRQAQLQLMHSEKLASIGQLAAGVAHEINNPVGFISSNMEVLEEYIGNYTGIIKIIEDLKRQIMSGETEEARLTVLKLGKFEEEINLDYIMSDVNNLLDQSARGLDRIKKIITDLRAFAREDSEEAMESVKVEGVIDSVLSIVQNEIKYKAELSREYADTPPVRCNAQRLGQVFINLLVNASQAMKKKGEIIVRTGLQGESVRIDVIDTGEGIAEGNLRKIFDPFFTTKPVGQGTGLGLSISYEIIKKHGGEILVQSKVGEGTTFTVILPAA